MDNEGLKVQHQELLFTLFGLYGHDAHEEFPVSVLVELLSAVGIKPPATRSLISRLKRSGTLINRRVGTESRYRLADAGADTFRHDDQQIFAPVRSTTNDSLVLAIFSVPETQRHRRYELRTLLAGLGFGMVASGVAIGPQFVVDHAIESLRERGLQEYVDYFRADYIPTDDIRAKVAQWWDLEALDSQYTEFLRLYVGQLEQWQNKVEAASNDADARRAMEQEAFAFYVPMLTRWRRFPYRDPNLPFEYLPDGWKAPQAKQVFLALHELLAPSAERYAGRLLSVRAG